VPKHEQYEELCTLAMIGEVSAAEMQDLRQHLSECANCREQYREFTQFLLPQLSISSDNDARFETGYSSADRERLRKDFLFAAEKKGRVFSEEAIHGTAETAAPPAAPVVPIRAPRYVYRYRWAMAASIAVLLFGSGYGTHLALVQRELASNHRAAGTAAAAQPGNADREANSADDAVARLQAANTVNAKTIADLQQRLSTTIGELQEAQHFLQTSQAGQSALQNQLNQKNGQLVALQSQAQGSQESMAELRTEVTQLQQRVNDSQAVAAANELRIRDLNGQLAAQTASLDREQQMLSVGRDVRDLMGARNLHIIDVHDANGIGKDRKSFGRIFYTEGKQLIFYAFDLDDKRVTNATYSYAAWGERLGQPGSVKSLGILYVDDKAQRRWSLKVNDPHQLAEINSVFVTLEPHAGEGAKPQGKRILFAFLGGEANHP
jgi:archaellum component FlaC